MPLALVLALRAEIGLILRLSVQAWKRGVRDRCVGPDLVTGRLLTLPRVSGPCRVQLGDLGSRGDGLLACAAIRVCATVMG